MSKLEKIFQRLRASGLLGRRFAIREIAVACYRAALNRQPSEQELADFIARIDADPQHLDAAVRAVFLTPQSIARNGPPLLRQVCGLTASDAIGDVVSLGTHCYTSEFLKRWQLKNWSGPFDWIFSSIPMVTHCLDDDFEIFLDRSHYEPIPTEQRVYVTVNRAEHRYYRDRFGVASVFNHHDVHLDEGYAYIRRCVERLRVCLASEQPKTFVVTNPVGANVIEHLDALHEALARRTSNFCLVAFLVGRQTSTYAQVRPLRAQPSYRAYAVTPMSAWQPLNFADIADELCLAKLLFAAMAAASQPAVALDCTP